MPQYVEVHMAPELPEFFRAVLIPGLHEVPQGDGVSLSVVAGEDGQPVAVPSECVRFMEEVPSWA